MGETDFKEICTVEFTLLYFNNDNYSLLGFAVTIEA